MPCAKSSTMLVKFAAPRIESTLIHRQIKQKQWTQPFIATTTTFCRMLQYKKALTLCGHEWYALIVEMLIQIIGETNIEEHCEVIPHLYALTRAITFSYPIQQDAKKLHDRVIHTHPDTLIKVRDFISHYLEDEERIHKLVTLTVSTS